MQVPRPTEKDSSIKNKKSDLSNVYNQVKHSPMNKNEISNDSALSSFQTHNLQNRNLKMNSKEINKEKSSLNTQSTEQMFNTASKDNFFKIRNSLDKKGQEINNDFKIENSCNSDKMMNTALKENFFIKNSNRVEEIKNMEEDSDNEYSGSNLEKKILEQQNLVVRNSIDNEGKYSKSGTFSSNFNEPQNLDKSSKINSTKDSKNFPKNHSQNYDDNENNISENLYQSRKPNAPKNTFIDRFNPNNPNYKTELHEYLQDLEKINKLSVDVNDNNQWILDFKDSITQDKGLTTKNFNSASKKNFSSTKNDSKAFYEMKNHIEILKKEKENLQKIIKEKNSYNYCPTRIDNSRMITSKGNFEQNKISDELLNYNSNFSDINPSRKMNSLKTQKDFKNYEDEIFEKINNEDIFEQINYQKEDVLGDFIDRVIEGSLYVYRNK